MAENRRTEAPAADRQRELDRQVEELTRRIAEVVRSAGGESGQDLREYAIGLLREETERDDVRPAGPRREGGGSFSPLPFALLVLPLGLALLLLFPPVGVGLVGMALVLGVWGVIATLLKR